jgi:hypothetical protein
MSARMQYAIFRIEYLLAAVISCITLIGVDEPVAGVFRMVHQLASHVSLFVAPENIQNENERRFKSGQHELVIHQRCGVD